MNSPGQLFIKQNILMRLEQLEDIRHDEFDAKTSWW